MLVLVGCLVFGSVASQTTYHPSRARSVVADHTIETTSALKLSEGYVNMDSSDGLIVSKKDAYQISIVSSKARPLQYTVCNIDGRIRLKGKIRESGSIDLQKLNSGIYAVYLFSGKNILKAFHVEKIEATGTTI